MFDMCCYKTKFSLFIMCRVYLLFLFSSSLMFILLAHTPGGNLLSPVFDDVKKTLKGLQYVMSNSFQIQQNEFQ